MKHRPDPQLFKNERPLKNIYNSGLTLCLLELFELVLCSESLIFPFLANTVPFSSIVVATGIILTIPTLCTELISYNIFSSKHCTILTDCHHLLSHTIFTEKIFKLTRFSSCLVTCVYVNPKSEIELSALRHTLHIGQIGWIITKIFFHNV